jgi:hypothetical protein
LRRDNVRAADEIVNALNERRILLAFEPVVRRDAAHAFHECLMRIRAPTVAGAGQRGDPDRRAARARPLLDHRVLEMLIGEMAAVPALKPASTSRRLRSPIRTGGRAGRAAARQRGVAER